MTLIHLTNPQATQQTTTMGPCYGFIHFDRRHCPVESKTPQSSTPLLWQGRSDGSLRKDRSDRSLWQGRSDRLLWQVVLTSTSYCTSTSANFVWLTLTTYSTFDPGTLVVTNPGGSTTKCLSYLCKLVHLLYTTSSTAVLCKLWHNSHTTLSLKESQELTAILSISLSKFCL